MAPHVSITRASAAPDGVRAVGAHDDQPDDVVQALGPHDDGIAGRRSLPRHQRTGSPHDGPHRPTTAARGHGREPNAYTLAGVAGSDAEQLPTCVE